MAVAPEAGPVALAPGASEAAERLFQEHSGWIYGYCLRLLRSPEEAEDALQTTYLNACRSLGRGTRPRVGSAWLLRIARNVCLARLRSSGRRGQLERAQDITILEETVAAPERAPEALMGLAEALGSLPDRQREAILLREWQGLSYGEVAERLGLTGSATETLIFRARRSLVTALEEPAKRGRRRPLHALDLGGLLAGLKGFFSGAAGLKVATALTVVTATTATVVATDPAGVWRDRHPVVAVQARAPAVPPPTGSASVRSSSTATLSAGPGPRRASSRARAAPAGERGHAFAAAAAKAKSKANGNGNGRALGLAKKASTAPKSSNGKGIPRNGRPKTSKENGRPLHAKARGLAKDRAPKAAKSQKKP